METFSVPVTALVAILLGSLALVIAVTEHEKFIQPIQKKGLGGLPYASESERLIWRFILSDKQETGPLWQRMLGSFGDRSSTLGIMAIDKWISKGGGRLDRAYALKASLYRSQGNVTQAMAYLNVALEKNPECSLARREMVALIEEEQGGSEATLAEGSPARNLSDAVMAPDVVYGGV